MNETLSGRSNTHRPDPESTELSTRDICVRKLSHRRRALTIYAMLASGLSALTLAGCGSVGKRPHTPGPGTSASLVTQMLDEIFPATGAENVDGAYFGIAEDDLQGIAQARCMARRGWTVRVPTVSPAKVDHVVEQIFEDYEAFPNLAWIARHRLFHLPGNWSVGWMPSPNVSHAEEVDSGRCELAAQRPMRAYIAASRELNTQWFIGVILRLQSSPRVQAASHKFTACLESKGIPADGARSLDDFLGKWLPRIEHLARSRAQFVATDHHLVSVFIPCATPLVTLQERLQKQARQRFFQTHYEAIKALERLTGKMMAALTRDADTQSLYSSRRS